MRWTGLHDAIVGGGDGYPAVGREVRHRLRVGAVPWVWRNRSWRGFRGSRLYDHAAKTRGHWSVERGIYAGEQRSSRIHPRNTEVRQVKQVDDCLWQTRVRVPV